MPINVNQMELIKYIKGDPSVWITLEITYHIKLSKRLREGVNNNILLFYDRSTIIEMNVAEY